MKESFGGTLDRVRACALVAAALAIAFLVAAPPGLHGDDYNAHLYYFRQEGCPNCTAMSRWLDVIEDRYPELEITRWEIRQTPNAIGLLRSLSAKYGIERLGVPAVFLGTRAWVGYNSTVTAGIERAIAECLETGCIDALRDPLPAGGAGETRGAGGAGGAAGDGATEAGTGAAAGGAGGAAAGAGGDRATDERFASMPLVLATALIALLDGVNPCSLWVLTFLLGMVVHTASRRRMILVGGVFLGTTALVYGLFIVGVVQALDLLSVVPWIRVAVAVLAFVMGALSVKEFFAFGRGPSLTVSERQKRSFGVRVRRLLSSDRSPLALAGGTALLAAGIALVELPCTAGFPVIWSGLVVEAETATIAFAMLLALYLVIYLADEAIIVAASTIAFKRLAMTEQRGRRLKLVGGVVMIALGVVMVAEPAILESLAGTAIVFGAAVALALFVILLDRRLRARG